MQNFNGTFKGAGQGMTFLDTLRGIDPSAAPLGPVTLDNSGNQVAPWPSLYGFVGGSVCVSDMTAAITDPTPGQGWNDYGTPTTALGTVFQVTSERSATFSRVTFHDGSGDFDGFNVTSDISVTGRQQLNADGLPTNLGTTGGSVTITACSFVGENGLFRSGLTHGSLTVSGNVFESAVCFYGCDASDSQITVSGNRMDGADCDVLRSRASLPATTSAPRCRDTPAPRYLITDNDLKCGDGTALLLLDNCPSLGFAGRLPATITGNQINLGSAASPAYAGIAEECTQNIKCYDNVLSGCASMGFALGDDQLPDLSYFPVSGWQIVGNDCRKLTASVADVYLGLGTTHCLVVGGPPPTTVLNERTGNILINVTPVADPPAAAATPMNSLRQFKQLKGAMLP